MLGVSKEKRKQNLAGVMREKAPPVAFRETSAEGPLIITLTLGQDLLRTCKICFFKLFCSST